MADKLKRQTNAHPLLSRFARFLYWVGWVGMLVSFIYAFQRFGNEAAISWLSGPATRTFHHLGWTSFTTALAFFVVGAIPSGFSILIGHLIIRVLHLEEENHALEELTQTLMHERDQADRSHRLIEQEVVEETVLDNDLYEQAYTRR